MASQNFRVKNGLEVGTGITISPNGNINSSGISTFNGVVIGGATTSLLVQGNARIIGILSVGQGTITFDGNNNQITVGSGITLSHTNGIYVGSSNITSNGLSIANINASGIVTAASFVGSIAGTASTASFATTSFGLAGSPNIIVGTVVGTAGTLIAGIGIQSGGVSIASTIKTLNFIGAGNTFNVVGDRLDVSISGSGGAGISSTGVSTAAIWSNPSFISTSYNLNSGSNNYGAFGPISIGVGATVNVGAGNTFVII